MYKFQKNKITLNNETVGERLKKERNGLDLSIEETGRRLKINPKYLEALENGQLRKLPAGVYAENYLKMYARFLSLSEEELLEQYLEENQGYLAEKEQVFVQRVTKTHHFLSLPKLLKVLVIIFLAGVCLAYLFYYLNNLLKPPFLEIISPSADISITEESIVVQGKTDKNASIKINGQEILSDKNGEFVEEVKLKQGLNRIIIEAWKKNSKKNEAIRNVLVKQ